MKRVSICLLALLAVVSCRESPTAAPLPSDDPKPIGSAPAPTPVATFEISMAAMGERVPVIMYHDIVKRRGRHTVWFDCTEAEFAEQMRTIEARGLTPISIDELHEHLTTGKPVGKAIVLTFDDNYQGFYDYAYPILKEKKFPAAIFVHTGFVGDKKGDHPKMDWPTLKELAADPLITIASHTVTHPAMPELPSDQQTKELVDSKETLETQLGKKIDYFAYPEGKNDKVTQSLVKDAGYTMAFSIDNVLAEESPSIECVGRYIHTRLDRALDAVDRSTEGGAFPIYRGELKATPVAYREEAPDGRRLAMVVGGTPASMTSATREGVIDFIRRSPGAVAGVNGTYFAMAAIKSTDNKLVGPCKTEADLALLPDQEPSRWPKLRNRPIVMWGPTGIAIVPFNPDRMNDDEAFRAFMPDFTDVFLGGVWLVHAGTPREKDALQTFASKDIEDPRRRAAFGLMADGTVVAAASKDSVSSSQFAAMLAAVGVQEAVLLDSGFSTSLVYGDKIMASGHSTPETPSRPVPHAIVFRGELDPASKELAANAVPATSADVASTPRRKRRRRRAVVNPDSATPAPDVQGPAFAPGPDAGPPP